MASIKDINGSIDTGFVISDKVGFDVPLVIGRTGQRSILKIGSGTSGLIIKSVVRDEIYNIIIVKSGSVYSYALVTDTITITVPATDDTVRDLVAAWDSAPSEVKAAITIAALTTGSGSLTALESTPMATMDVYQKIVDPIQIEDYYDTTDEESIIINNMLGGSGSHIIALYLLDSFGTDAADLGTFVTTYDLGDWWAACLANIDETESQVLTDYFSNKKRLFFAITDAVAELATVQGRVVYIVHPSAQMVNHLESSLMAKGLVPAPGSSDWAGIANLHNQTPDETTDLSGLLAIRAANGNAYIKQSGNNFMQDGRVNQVGASDSSPVYIADILFQDWLILTMEARLKELILSKIAQGSKLSYDNKGIQESISTLATVLTQGAKAGGIAEVSNADQAAQSYDGIYRFNVTAQSREQIEINSPEDIVQQILKNLRFWYVKSGTIQKITFNGLELLTEPAA